MLRFHALDAVAENVWPKMCTLTIGIFLDLPADLEVSGRAGASLAGPVLIGGFLGCRAHFGVFMLDNGCDLECP